MSVSNKILFNEWCWHTFRMDRLASLLERALTSAFVALGSVVAIVSDDDG